MSEVISISSITCPRCRSFYIHTRLGDVKGKSVLDGWAQLSEPQLKPQSFTTRHYAQNECNSCGLKWDYRENDGITLTMEARRPTLMERMAAWFS